MKKKKIKRIVALICPIIILVVLFVFVKSVMLKSEITAEVAGREVVIDTVDKTITDREYLYEYHMYSYGDDKTKREVHEFRITYPNGYEFEMDGSRIETRVTSLEILEKTDMITLEQEYRENYISGEELVALLKSTYCINDTVYIDNANEEDKNAHSANEENTASFDIVIVSIIIAIVSLFVLGVYNIKYPEKVWYRRFGRHILNAEPTYDAIDRIVFSGWFSVILSIGMAIWFLYSLYQKLNY